MSVANELTSDVTAFVLTNEDRTPKETKQLLIEFHSTLRRLTLEARRQRLAKLALENSLPLSKKTTSM